MAVDYDLVVIGSTPAGIYAAKSAVQLQARVALVTQSDRPKNANWEDIFLPNDVLFNYSFATVGRFKNLLANSSLTATKDSLSLSLTEAGEWIQDSKRAVQSLDSLSNLATLGVDVIVGKGEFCAKPQLKLQVETRSLISRRFLLATGSNFTADFLDPDVCKNYLTIRDLEREKLSELPTNIIIIGSEPIALELAHNLSIFGKKVTLVVREKRILPQEDRDISSLMQAQLEAAGIAILVDSHISQIKIINEQKWVQAGDRAICADEIIVADCRQPNIAELNLAGVNVKHDRRRVCVNQKLETTNPNIYACGDLIGGYSLPNIARYEVKVYPPIRSPQA